ncbi:transferase [Aureococcus anophagefferens]|nr:transferase [Aureococcus anophagefferens]
MGRRLQGNDDEIGFAGFHFGGEYIFSNYHAAYAWGLFVTVYLLTKVTRGGGLMATLLRGLFPRRVRVASVRVRHKVLSVRAQLFGAWRRSGDARRRPRCRSSTSACSRGRRGVVPHPLASLPNNEPTTLQQKQVNALSFRAVETLQWQGLDANEWRQKKLGLRRLDVADRGASLLDDFDVPFTLTAEALAAAFETLTAPATVAVAEGSAAMREEGGVAALADIFDRRLPAADMTCQVSLFCASEPTVVVAARRPGLGSPCPPRRRGARAGAFAVPYCYVLWDTSRAVLGLLAGRGAKLYECLLKLLASFASLLCLGQNRVFACGDAKGAGRAGRGSRPTCCPPSGTFDKHLHRPDAGPVDARARATSAAAAVAAVFFDAATTAAGGRDRPRSLDRAAAVDAVRSSSPSRRPASERQRQRSSVERGLAVIARSPSSLLRRPSTAAKYGKSAAALLDSWFPDAPARVAVVDLALK